MIFLAIRFILQLRAVPGRQTGASRSSRVVRESYEHPHEHPYEDRKNDGENTEHRVRTTHKGSLK